MTGLVAGRSQHHPRRRKPGSFRREHRLAQRWWWRRRRSGRARLDEFVDHRVESEDTSLEAERILRRLLDVASGELCVAERERLGQFAISQLWTSF